MHNSKQTTFHTAKPSLHKPCILNNEMIQETYLKPSIDVSGLNKAAGKTQLKGLKHFKKVSKNKLSPKDKQAKKKSAKKANISSSNTNAQQKKNQNQGIKNSKIYQTLFMEFLNLKSEQFQMRREVKRQLQQLTDQVRTSLERRQELKRIRDNLRGELAYLNSLYNELRLQNYELRCQLCERGEYQRSYYYDTVPFVDEDQSTFQDRFALYQQLSDVDIGYSQTDIDKLPIQRYNFGHSEDKCCICYGQFEQNEAVFKTECKHVHHHDCLKKWLKIKRICPLCRNQIVLK